MNKEKESQLRKAYSEYIDLILYDFPIERMDEIVDDNMKGFGSTVDEKFRDINRFKRMILDQREQGADSHLRWKQISVHRRISPKEDTAIYTDEFTLTLQMEGEDHIIPLRLSSIFEFDDHLWKLVHIHGSTGVETEDNDTWHKEEWNAKQAELERQVKEKTEELISKNRELEIEAALERVRARSIAMRKSEELAETATVLYKELSELGLKDFLNCGFVEVNESKDVQHGWMTMPNGTISEGFKLPLKGDGVLNERNKHWMAQDPCFHQQVGGKKLKDHIDFVMPTLDSGEVADMTRQNFPDPTIFYCANFKQGYLHLITNEELSVEHEALLVRFTGIFQQTYTRFLDLKKAEGQAREAQIEAALERVRARTMAMHKGDELAETALLLFEQISDLGIKPRSCGFLIMDEKSKSMEDWSANLDEKGNASIITGTLAFDQHPIISDVVATWQKGDPYFIGEIHGTELQKYYEAVTARETTSKAIREEVLAKAESEFTNSFYFEYGMMYVLTPEGISEQQIDIMLRFASVFKLTYRRFLDLKQAEAQAREAQIEAALERVRAKAMAMHTSKELQDVINSVYEQIVLLGVDLDSVNFNIFYPDSKDVDVWVGTTGKMYTQPVYLPYINFGPTKKLWEAKERGEQFLNEQYVFNKKNKWWTKVFEVSDFKYMPAERKKLIMEADNWVTSMAIDKNSSIQFHRFGKASFDQHENEIQKRFAKVFEQAYTRFLDLQKAEAQAWEAQIEAALERVRAKAMAMHSTTDISDATAIVFNELTGLGVEMERCGIAILHDESSQLEIWSTPMSPKDKKVKEVITGYLNADFHPMIQYLFDEWRKKKTYSYYTLVGFEVREYYKRLGKISGYQFPKIDTYPDRQMTHCFFFEHGDIFVNSQDDLSKEQKQLLHRFTRVFSLTYKRYLDLKNAEAQAREAQIEAAIERVRARTMAMHKSEELADVIDVVFKELRNLDFQSKASDLFIIDEKTNHAMVWISGELDHETIHVLLGNIKNAHHQHSLKAWKKGDQIRRKELKGKVCHNFMQSMLDNVISGKFPIHVKKFLVQIEKVIHTDAYHKYGFFRIAGLKFLSKQEEEILIRFTRVFEQAYTRFLDLQKAEAQAREAQIEASLERVRAKAMAMHSTEDISEAIAIVFNEITRLGIAMDRCGIVILNEQSTVAEVWSTPLSDKNRLVTKVITGHLDCDMHPMLRQVYKAWKNKDEYFNFNLAGQDLLDYYNKLEKVPGYRFPKIKNYPDRQAVDCYFFDEGYIFTYTRKDLLDEVKQIFHRFTKVFSLTYRRYIDLKNAERQAREAQIETALERLRSASMAMHNSNDVGDTIVTLFDQVSKLGLDDDIRCGIGILKESERMETWSATSYPNGEVDLKMGLLDMSIHPMLKRIKRAWENGVSHYTDQMSGKSMVKYYTALNNEPDYSFQRNLDTLPRKEFHNSFSFSEGILFSFSPNLMSKEASMVLKRFAYVFGQTYRRYIDLLNAEAQAREAQIEAALERIRAKAMAMQTSADLHDVSIVLREQMGLLGQKDLESSIVHLYNNSERLESWYTFRSTETDSTKIVTDVAFIPVDCCDYIKETISKYKSNEQEYTIVSKGKKLKDWYNIMVDVAPDTIEYEGNGKMIIPKILYYHHSKFMGGALLMISNQPPSEESKELQFRAAKVFNLAYQRFLDLQQAEERARESIKQASLDRVRAEIASMRATKDLERITPLIWKELTALGVPFFRCGIFILNEQEQMVHAYLSTPSGDSLAALHFGFDETDVGLIAPAIKYWRKQKAYNEEWNKERFIKNMELFMKRGDISSPEKYQAGDKPPEKLALQLVPFKQGMLYVGNSEVLISEHVNLMQELADTFSVAYSRYEDFTQLEQAKHQIEKALAELKSTQTQLIHSEKMASLGELTAGIAHEIQNPLNFVNNFSEVSNDLIEELKEEKAKPADKREEELEEELLNDLIENLEKIHHHGQRASSIVRGMLEHSRTGKQEKEATDLNVLADEYLRLAYHGLRAKDKSFNAEFKTVLDEKLPKVHVIGQDIGRVLLNLINNAFYACVEQKKNIDGEYKPQVIVSTQLNDKTAEIVIQDNGKGIPKDVVDKIFQPFFTTKPTGQGTGLGLSLSYDIITKGHNGYLEVETEEGLGTRFIIRLPV